MDSTKFCQCKSITASPCIVCGKPKFIDSAWLRRKIEEDGDEGEVGAGFELFPIPEARVSLMARTVRQTLRDYGHGTSETSLPECIAADLEAALTSANQP